MYRCVGLAQMSDLHSVSRLAVVATAGHSSFNGSLYVADNAEKLFLVGSTCCLPLSTKRNVDGFFVH